MRTPLTDEFIRAIMNAHRVFLAEIKRLKGLLDSDQITDKEFSAAFKQADDVHNSSYPSNYSDVMSDYGLHDKLKPWFDPADVYKKKQRVINLEWGRFTQDLTGIVNTYIKVNKILGEFLRAPQLEDKTLLTIVPARVKEGHQKISLLTGMIGRHLEGIKRKDPLYLSYLYGAHLYIPASNREVKDCKQWLPDLGKLAEQSGDAKFQTLVKEAQAAIEKIPTLTEQNMIENYEAMRVFCLKYQAIVTIVDRNASRW